MRKYLLILIIVFTSSTEAQELNLAQQAINKLAIELNQKLPSIGNTCISPYSIQTALSMVYAGASGTTKQEMKQALFYPQSDDRRDELFRSFATLNQDLVEMTARSKKFAEHAKLNGGKSEAIDFQVANRLFGKKGYHFNSNFLDILKVNYDAPIEELDFVDRANAVNRINNWVAEITRRKFLDLLDPSALSPDSRLILVNALYLKAPWADEFEDSLTRPKAFTINPPQIIQASTMFKQAYFSYEKRKDYTVVGIPYAGNELQFLVFLPDAPLGLSRLEKSLTAEDISSAAKMDGHELLLYLPKFNLRPDAIELGEQLIDLGMPSAFDQPVGSADFKEMLEKENSEYLFISKVIHKTMFTLDEHGTEAAAATAIMMLAGSALPTNKPEPIEVRVDHPFLYAVQHRPSGVLLFFGRVLNPTL